MLLRDRLLTRIKEMGAAPDYPLLAAEVLGIRNAPADLARRLVAQALVVEDRREAWQRAGQRVCAAAPTGPGVYVLRDDEGRVLYVGKAIDLRRRLRTHFALRRWRGLRAPLARAAHAEWEQVGSELEALLREAVLINELRPVVNVQTAPPQPRGRAIPASLVKNAVIVLPSVDPDSAEIVAVRVDGRWRLTRLPRSGIGVMRHARALMRFFRSADLAAAPPPDPSAVDVPIGDRLRLAPLAFSWLAARGQRASRLDPGDCATAAVLAARLRRLLGDTSLFTERLDVR